MSEDEKIPKLSIEEIEKEDPFKNRTDFYVYVHYTNESTPRPFYGGKGCGNRAHRDTSRTLKWKSVRDKYGLMVKIIYRELKLLLCGMGRYPLRIKNLTYQISKLLIKYISNCFCYKGAKDYSHNQSHHKYPFTIHNLPK